MWFFIPHGLVTIIAMTVLMRKSYGTWLYKGFSFFIHIDSTGLKVAQNIRMQFWEPVKSLLLALRLILRNNWREVYYFFSDIAMCNLNDRVVPIAAVQTAKTSVRY